MGSWPKGTMVVAPRSHAPPCVLRVINFPAISKGPSAQPGPQQYPIPQASVIGPEVDT